MLLMIDNYDSFTFNLVQYFRELGEWVKVFRNDEIDCAMIEKLSPDKIVISPGPCSPDQAGISLEVIQHFSTQLPILGVCLGHQALAQTFGGRIIRAEKVMHGKTSTIFHSKIGIFQDLPEPLIVTRYHSLVVDISSLPEELEVTAWSYNEAGEKESIMAIQHKTLPLYGVQFHPEAILTECGHQLLNNFLKL